MNKSHLVGQLLNSIHDARTHVYKKMYKFFFYNKFVIFLYMFRAQLCSSSGGQIVSHTIWYRHTEITHLFQCDDTRCCIIKFWPPDDEHIVLETCRGI